MRVKIPNLDVATRIFATVEEQEADWLALASPGTEVHVTPPLSKGPETQECIYDTAMVTPWLLEEIRTATEEGFDAVIIPCMADPGLYAAREITNIPIVGVAETSYLLAIGLGYKFTILVPLKESLGECRQMLLTYGFERFVASIRVLHLTVEEICTNKKRLKEALVREGKAAVEEDGADVIVMGCGFMSGITGEIKEELGVPIIDPYATAMAFAEMLVRLGLSHSKKAYMTPPAKRIVI